MQMRGNSNFNETRGPHTEFVRLVQIEFMVQLNTAVSTGFSV